MQLTRRSHVRPKDVAVLTPYAAQVKEIRRALVEKSEGAIGVDSIAKSQGMTCTLIEVSCLALHVLCPTDLVLINHTIQRYPVRVETEIS